MTWNIYIYNTVIFYSPLLRRGESDISRKIIPENLKPRNTFILCGHMFQGEKNKSRRNLARELIWNP